MEPSIVYQLVTPKVNGKHITIMSINVHSLRNKLQHLTAEVLRLGRISLIAVSETWIEPGTENYFNLAGYRAYHEIREDGYGGLSVFIRDDISHNLIDKMTQDGIHMISIKLSSIKIVSLYRQPSNNMHTFLNLLRTSSETNEKCIVNGDMNIDLLPQSRNLSRYNEILEENSLFILNKIDHSFSTFPQSGSIIDHFCANFLDRHFVLFRTNSDISDHVTQILEISDMPFENEFERLKKTDWKRVHQMINNFVMNSNTYSLENLHNFLVNAVNENTHELPLSRNQSQSWFNQVIASEMSLRDFLNQRRRDESLPESDRVNAENFYGRQRNKVTNLIRCAKKTEISNLIQSAMGRQNEMWKVINYVLTNKKKRSAPDFPQEIFLPDDSLTSDRHLILDTFADYFSNVAGNLKQALLQANHNRQRCLTVNRRIPNQMDLLPTSSEEVSRAIAGLKTKAAGGFDRTPASFWKSVKPPVIDYIARAINESFGSGIFPSSFKLAKVICLHKS